MRFSSKSTLTGLVIAVAAGSLLLTGLSTSLSGFNDVESGVAATVGNQSIPMQVLSQKVRELDRGEADETRKSANIQNALNGLVTEAVWIEEASRYGWIASDVEVARWIRSVPAFQNPTTKQFDSTIYKKFLANQGMSELEIYRIGRNEITKQHLASLLSVPAYIPAQLVEAKYARDNVKFDLEFLEVRKNDDLIKTASNEQVTAYLNDEKNIAKLQETYEKTKSEFVRKAQVNVKSILVAFKGAERSTATRSEAEALDLANKIQARVKGNEDFAKISQEVNDDAKAKQNGGDLGWIDDTLVDPETSKRAFELTSSKSVSEVLKTPFGFRIIKLVEKRPEIAKSFEDVKQQLAEREVLPQAREAMRLALDKQMNEALAANDAQKVAELVKKERLSWKKMKGEFSGSSRYIPEIGLSDPLFPYVFQMRKKGDMTPQVVDFSGRGYVFKLNSRQDGEAPNKEKLEATRRMASMQESQLFSQATQKKLFDVYTRNKEIQRNKALIIR